MTQQTQQPQGSINWNRNKLKKLKEQYEIARALGGDGFVYYSTDGSRYEFVTAYAGYLIEYLDSNLPDYSDFSENFVN